MYYYKIYIVGYFYLENINEIIDFFKISKLYSTV